ncbi:MAG: hypothetical protein A3F68_02725 [Acidobacteria bacterium RIFCSPLOWO2_12_FULL_54_10]|nr:MAG: hypothetical protein A3F68_02725 [Acidobacteria bacterium RIFCSPLOWO2_12_FULL_54_10]
MALMVLWSGIAAQAWQLGARETKEWVDRLENPERIAGLKIGEVIQRLGLKPGMIVADIGAGTGVFSRSFAKAVAPGGKVYATEVDQGLVDFIGQKAKQVGIGNLQAILGKFEDPLLPSRDVDLAFFHDVMHHIEHREAYLKTLISYLKPTGRIALIEFEPASQQHPHQEPGQAQGQQEGHMQVSKESVTHWLAGLGFRPAAEPDLFKGNKWFVIFERGTAPADEDIPEISHH